MIATSKEDKCPSKYDPYQPVESVLHRQIARDELREEPEMAEQALQQMREWIAKNRSIVSCRTDASFLLRFLRMRKFSHVAACETLERYLTMRQRFPAWFGRLDPSEPWVQKVIDSGFVIPLGRDEKGRSVFLIRYANLDIDQFDAVQQIRFFTIMFECFLEDALSGIAGLVWIFDEANVPLRAFAQWTLSEIKNYVSCLRTYPMRVKEVHIMNLSKVGAAIGELATGLCSEKLRSRVKYYSSLEDFVRKTNLKELLPTEYGGNQSTVEMKEVIRKTFHRYRDIIVRLDDMQVDETLANATLQAHNRADLDTSVVGSFRKLCID